MSKVTIIDSIMGSGKTTWAVNFIKQRKDKQFLYVTPYLDECKRIVKATKPEHNFVEPSVKWPKLSKLVDIHSLVNASSDIATSHELFKRFNESMIDLLSICGNKYVLLIDEVMELVSPTEKIGKLDVKTLTESALIVNEKTGACTWNENYVEDTHYKKNAYRYNDVKELALTNNLVKAQTYLLWRYNPKIFELFDEIYVMTYLFDGSIMKGYFDYHNIQYEKMSIDNGELVPFRNEDTTRFREMINIYVGNMNNGYNNGNLSKSWYEDKNNKKYFVDLSNNMDNYFRNILEAKSKTRLWTVYGDYREAIEKSRYKKNFISCNARATNEYSKTYNLVYLVNMNINPGVIHYLSQRNIPANKDQYSLSMMLQWIWRSRIRNGEPINIYIPSYRMRKLLYEWIGLDILEVEGPPVREKKRTRKTVPKED